MGADEGVSGWVAMRDRVDGRRWADERSGTRKYVTDGRMDGWMDKRRRMDKWVGTKGDKRKSGTEVQP